MIVNRQLSDIKELKNNPRKISHEELERLKRSLMNDAEMLEFRPVVLSDRTGELVVIAGNQRVKAARALGWKEIPTYLCQGLTEEKERAIVLKDNDSNGEWDLQELESWVDALDMAEMDILMKTAQEEAESVMQDDKEEVEVKFTETLNEEHNYLMLYFDNKVDWLQAETMFNLSAVKELSTRRDGEVKSSFRKFGIGRVLNGAKALNLLKGGKE